jgi:hypothetical protein
MDYTVYSGEWPVGRIYEERGSAQDQRWFWSLFGILANPPDMHTNGRAPTLEAAKAEFEVYRTRFIGHKFELSGLLHAGLLPSEPRCPGARPPGGTAGSMERVDGLRPPSLPTGPTKAADDSRKLSFMRASFSVPVDNVVSKETGATSSRVRGQLAAMAPVGEAARITRNGPSRQLRN